jgi:hypothetical protein
MGGNDDRKIIELQDNVIYLDLYRRNWTVGIIFCAECDTSVPHMWVTGASVVECPKCLNKVPLYIDRET